MWENIIFSLFVFTLIFTLAEYIQTLTKGIIATFIPIVAIYMTGYLTGLIPSTSPADVGFSSMVNGFMLYLVITHLGTTITPRQLLNEWKTVVLCLGSMIIMCVVLLTVGSLIVGHDYAAASVGPIAGGLVTAMLEAQYAVEAGKPELESIMYLLVSFQSMFGVPIATLLLRSYIKDEVRLGHHLTSVADGNHSEATKSWRIIPELPAKFNTPNSILVRLLLITLLAQITASVTNNVLPAAVLALVFGIFANAIGFLEPDSLNKAGYLGFFMFCMMGTIPISFSTYTLDTLKSVVGILLILLAMGAVALIISGLVMSKIMKIPAKLAATLSLLYVWISVFSLDYPGSYSK